MKMEEKDSSKAGESSAALREVLKLQSLLMQFIHPQVRYDFLAGNFECDSSEGLLHDLDCIKSLIIPPCDGDAN